MPLEKLTNCLSKLIDEGPVDWLSAYYVNIYGDMDVFGDGVVTSASGRFYVCTVPSLRPSRRVHSSGPPPPPLHPSHSC